MDSRLKHTLGRYMAGNFTCREMAQLVTDYLEGSLTFRERIRFQLHLGLCFACRNYLRQMKYTIATLRHLPPDPIPPHVKDELITRFRNWKYQSTHSPPKPEIE